MLFGPKSTDSKKRPIEALKGVEGRVADFDQPKDGDERIAGVSGLLNG